MKTTLRYFSFILGTLALATLRSAMAEPLTPEHVAKIRYVAAAKISPDGEHIAYLLSVPRRPGQEDDGPAYLELHVVNARGESRPYITGPVSLSDLEWTPDGQGISYLAKREKDEHKALYVIPLNGGESRRYLSHDTGIGGYSWSPDGKRVAFLATEPETKELKEQKEKGFNQQIYEEDVRMTQVWIATPDPEAESPDEPRQLNLPGHASAVHWSPAGDRLAVALAPTPTVDDSFMRRILYIVDVISGNVAAKLEHPAKLGEFAWSPDGERLFTISGEDIHDPRDGRLLLWSAEGGEPKNLVPNYLGHVSAAAWKNGGTIFFIGTEGVWTALREVTLEGAEIEAGNLQSGPILRSISLSRDGSVAALVADSPAHPEEVFRVSGDDRDFTRLTQSNPWLKDIDLARQEEVRYQAQDGLEIQGVLVRPLNEEEGRRYPLIMAVHGGPESCVSHGWVTSYASPGQMAAAEGMAVFYPNYRGSTGRGVEFSKMGQADAAGPEFRDIVDGIDLLVETGLVDGKKVGITGGSYGGYASAWGATYYTERYAASVMFVGISDNISKVGTTDIPDEMYLVHHRKRLWDDWEYFLKSSPIRYVEQARTPLLILHGKDDPRVHPAQSLELHRHLKTLGQAPVRLVLYPGEGHGNRRAASRLDYSLRMMRWMKHYLQGPGGEPPAYELDYGLENESEEEEENDSEED